MRTASEILRESDHLRRNQEFAAAEAGCRDLLGREPDHAEALHLLSLIAGDAGRDQEALQLLDSALKLRPNEPRLHESAASLLARLGHGEAAQRHAQQASWLHQWRLDFAHLPADLLDYQLQVESLRRSVYMDFPREVAIETMTVCNAACTFCPYPSLERKGTKMGDALLEKILSDLEDIPREVSFSISPFKLSDPFLDVRLFDIIDRCRVRLPNAAIRLFTNGSALTGSKLDALERTTNVEQLWLSVNHHLPDEYEAVMQLPWPRIVSRLDMVHERVERGSLSLPVVVSRVCDGSAHDAAFADWVADHYPRFLVQNVAQTDWLGEIEGAALADRIPPVGCSRWFELSIASTGEVAFCCMDGTVAYPIGDVMKQHALEVYNSPRYRAIRAREADRSGTDPCLRCTNF